MKKSCKIIVMLISLTAMICSVLICFNGCTEDPEVPSEFTYSINVDKTTCTLKGTTKTDVVDLVIPEQIDGYTVTKIAPYAFKNSGIATVSLPSTIELIGESAFTNCSNLQFVYGLENCTNLKEIKANTFSYCIKLCEVKFPNNIESIGRAAFLECENLRYVYGLENCTKLTEIKDEAFSNCHNLEKIELPFGLKKIGASAFRYCYENLKSINIPTSVTSIGDYAFAICFSLKSIEIPASVENIGHLAFYFCTDMEEIKVDSKNPYWASSNGVLYTKDMKTLHTFPSGKKCAEFVVPDGVTTIFRNAFSLPTYLQTISLPDSIEKISSEIIYDAYGYSHLTTIFYSGTVEMWGKISKASDWDKDSLDYIILCTDGQISKDGTVTYN